MVFKMTIEIDGREVEILERQVGGSPSEREEQVHQLAQQAEQVMALTEAAEQVRRPCSCGRPMENRGRAAVRLRCLSGEIRVRRRRYRCRTCGRELYPADALLKCGRHRLTQPLAKRACQLATVEHFTRLPQLLWDQHGVRLGPRGSWSPWFTMWAARPRSVAGWPRNGRPSNGRPSNGRPSNRHPAGQLPKSVRNASM